MSLTVSFDAITPVEYLMPQNRVKSEYDEYREKYRLFDSALFCMPPDNFLRRSCNKILTAQLNAPSSSPTSGTQDLKILSVRKIKFVFQ